MFTGDVRTGVKIVCSCQQYETAWCATENDARERWRQHALAMMGIPFTKEEA